MKKQFITTLTMGGSGSTHLAMVLCNSGVFMGDNCRKIDGNQGWCSKQDIINAAKFVGDHVVYKGDYKWNFDKLFSEDPPSECVDIIENYISDLKSSDKEIVGWKVPGTFSLFPWLFKIIPNIKIILNIKDPRDLVFKLNHNNLFFDRSQIIYGDEECPYKRSAMVWKCAYDLAIQTINIYSEQILIVRTEDMIFEQNKTLERISDFLNIEIHDLPVRCNPMFKFTSSNKIYFPLELIPISKYITDDYPNYWNFLKEGMSFFKYSNESYWIPNNKEKFTEWKMAEEKVLNINKEREITVVLKNLCMSRCDAVLYNNLEKIDEIDENIYKMSCEQRGKREFVYEYIRNNTN